MTPRCAASSTVADVPIVSTYSPRPVMTSGALPPSRSRAPAPPSGSRRPTAPRRDAVVGEHRDHLLEPIAGVFLRLDVAKNVASRLEDLRKIEDRGYL